MSDARKNITPYIEADLAIKDLLDEAKVWLDGSKVKTSEQDEVVKNLLKLAKDAKKQANAARVVEKRPHDEAGKAVQAKFKPMLTTVDAIISGCQASRNDYLVEQDRAKREAEQKARDAADEAERLAQQAMQQTSVTDVGEHLEAERLVEQAKQADKAARKAAKPTATGLRKTYTPELTSLSKAINYYWKTNQQLFFALIMEQAVKDVRAGARSIPGFEIIEKKGTI